MKRSRREGGRGGTGEGGPREKEDEEEEEEDKEEGDFPRSPRLGRCLLCPFTAVVVREISAVRCHLLAPRFGLNLAAWPGYYIIGSKNRDNWGQDIAISGVNEKLLAIVLLFRWSFHGNT